MKFFLTLTVFVSAVLLFMVQPMLAKALLPQVGGAAGTWIVSMLFFQLLLLVGYGYAALTSAWLSPMRQALLHQLIILIAIFAAVPLALHMPDLKATDAPQLWVMLTLLASVGLPYIVLAATSSLLQRWYYALFASEPYHLFSASNAGSFIGLFAYPFMVEWLWPLSDQYQGWSLGFMGLGLLFLLLLLGIMRARKGCTALDTHRQQLSGLPARHVLSTIFIAFVPSSLFLSITLLVTTDIAALPLLWVIPLALYLLSFVVAFAPWGGGFVRFAQRIHPIVLLVSITLLIIFTHSVGALLLHYGLFFLIALSCHGQLCAIRPAPQKLTAFFFWVALGGALGGVLNVMTPFLLNDVYEYIAVLILSILALPGKYTLREGLTRLKAFGWRAPIGAILTLSVIAAMWLLPARPSSTTTSLLYQSRNFFGVSRVSHIDDYHRYSHGTTMHGIQSLNDKIRLTPLSYYTPIQQLISLFPDSYYARPFGVIGLGAGTLACTGRIGQKVDFYEIDRQVIDIATNPDYFTYLRDCPPDITLYEGDGRIELRERADALYNLLVLDAFSSDAIPLHLLSREALQEYIRTLDPTSGIIAFNISNRYLRLAPYLSANAEAEGWIALSKLHMLPAPETDSIQAIMPSEWLLMIAPHSPWLSIIKQQGFSRVEIPLDTPQWSDHYSSIIPAIRWGQ